MSAMVGLFIGLVERIARTAWVRLVLGKNEGREWSLDSAVTHLGRDERAGIPLWGDPNVAPLHATIARQGPHWVLQDHGSPLGTVLNGQRIGQAGLMPGSVFQIGRHTLEFLTKGGPRASAVPMAPVTPAPGDVVYPRGVVLPAGPSQGVFPQGVTDQGGVTNQGAPINPAPQPPSASVSPAAAMPKEAIVVATDGPLAGARIVFADAAEIGREGGALPLPFDKGVSRRHARLTISPNGLLLEDLGSTNGTFVAGARIDRTFLRAGDVFKIGLTTFRVEKAE
ncbi:FHA domain-containing protein, partial [bacterium]